MSASPGPGAGRSFDLGQNINGWVRLRDLGPEGTALTLVHGEALDAAGDLTTTHLDVDLPFLPEPLPAGQVDRVISAGRPGEVFEPRHTTHGFRYVRVEGHPGELTADDRHRRRRAHRPRRAPAGFECSDERINRLHEAAVWSLRGNACDVPTDCPTRERAGWTGDWQLFVPTAAFLYDVAGFSHQVAARPGRRADGRGPGRQPRPEPARGVRGRPAGRDERLRRLGRRRRDRAVGDLPRLRRRPPARRAVAVDGGVAGVRRARRGSGPASRPRSPGRPSRVRTSAACGTPDFTSASGSSPGLTSRAPTSSPRSGRPTRPTSPPPTSRTRPA